MTENDWVSATAWALPLSAPPQLRFLSFGTHGDVPRERYRLRGLWCLHLYRYAGEARDRKVRCFRSVLARLA